MRATCKNRAAFTLIEMLTVIAIMGIIAGMVVHMNSAAVAARKRGMVDAEKERLKIAIESYQGKLGFYPPDNGSTATATLVNSNYEGFTATNPLLYELVGAITTNSGGTYSVSNLWAAPIKGTDFQKIFNRGGIANSDANDPQNFFKPLPQPKDYTNYIGLETDMYGLIVPAPLTPTGNNYWHYDSSSPYRHNPNSYDLWAEYSIGTKNGQLVVITNGNW
jgi:prepilin-type N-terminal cleavage/methylation domain-containing protein